MWKLDERKHPKLVKVLKFVRKVLKWVAITCFVAVIVLYGFFMARSCSSSNSAAVVRASAEESVSRVADSGIDSTLYPSANLFYPDNLPTEDWGGRLVREGYTITALYSTYASFFSGLSLLDYFPDIKAGVPYTFSCTISSNDNKPQSAQYGIFISGLTKMLIPNFKTGYVSNTVIFEESDLEKNVYFYGGISSDSEDFYVKWENLTCNRGEIAYPFSPNLGAIYNSGYSQGYGQGETDGAIKGYEDGFKQGLSEGVSVAEAGYFANAKIYTTLNLYSNSRSEYQTFNSGPYTDLKYITSGINFDFLASPMDTFANSYLKQAFYKDNGFYWRSTTVNVYFNNPVPISTISLGGVGHSNSFLGSVSLTTTDNEIYVCAGWSELASIGGWILDLPDLSGDTLVSYLSFTWGNGADGLSVSLWDLRLTYYAGYTEGYNNAVSENSDIWYGKGYDIGYVEGIDKGQIEGYENGRIEGIDIGYADGYNVGREFGYQEGFDSAKVGTFGWLIGSVQSFLDVNFFGDFGVGTLLYVGLGITLVTLFLKMFAGG